MSDTVIAAMLSYINPKISRYPVRGGQPLGDPCASGHRTQSSDSAAAAALDPAKHPQSSAHEG
jgi:hypothetical protein